MKKKSFLITGGTGFIGANLIQRLSQERATLHLLVKPNSDLWRLESLKIEFILHEVDLENLIDLEPIVKKISPDVIFHLGAHGVSSLHHNRFRILMSNVIGTFNLLQATKEVPYEAFIHMGGSSEYGKKNTPMSEQDMPEPITFYGMTKTCASLLALQFATEHNKPINILRAFSVYGPLESPRRLIPTAIHSALTGSRLHLTQPGFARDYIFVQDVVDACLRCWKKGVKREILNIGTGIQTTNEQVIQLIEKLTNQKIDLSMGTFSPRLSDHSFWVANNDKAKKILDWQPSYTLEQGLEKTLHV